MAWEWMTRTVFIAQSISRHEGPGGGGTRYMEPGSELELCHKATVWKGDCFGYKLLCFLTH